CEESHGILVTPQIRDKDAAAAALLLAELTLEQKRRGKTVIDYVDAIERRFGYFRNEVRTISLPGIEGRHLMAKMLDRLRREPPGDLGGLPGTGVDDLQSENTWLGPLKGATDRAARNVLHFRLGDSARVALRPSGTEPKAKVYIESCSPPCRAGAPVEQWEQTRREVDRQAHAIGDDFMQRAMRLVPAPLTR